MVRCTAHHRRLSSCLCLPRPWCHRCRWRHVCRPCRSAAAPAVPIYPHNSVSVGNISISYGMCTEEHTCEAKLPHTNGNVEKCGGKRGENGGQRCRTTSLGMAAPCASFLLVGQHWMLAAPAQNPFTVSTSHVALSLRYHFFPHNFSFNTSINTISFNNIYYILR